MFNAIEIYGNNVFNLHFTKGCSCLSGNVVYLIADKRPVGVRESSPDSL